MEREFNDDGSVTVKYSVDERKKFDKEYLEQTAEYMLSDDYKKRFIAEYRQTLFRFKKLGIMLEKYKAGTLDFVPLCSYELLEKQWNAMKAYTEVLVERAHMENIDFWKEESIE